MLVVAQAATAVAAPVATAPVAAVSVAKAPAVGRAQQPLSAAQAAQLSRSVSQHVIVFMKDQPAMTPARTAALAARSAAIAADQRAVISEFSRVHAAHVIAYRLVNAVAATVSAAEVARLKANPAVARVIPDAIIQGPSLPARPAGPAASAGSAAQAGPAQAGARVKAVAGACLAHGKVQLEPEALQVTHTQSLNKHAATARSLGFTGAGVTVAWIADGIDIHNVNFIRANGKSAFVAYKDFSGDGTSAVTPGGEAFLDANSIAGQGRHVYNVQNYTARSLSAPCNIRIEGVAPGASLVGLKVFGQNNDTTTSAFLDAINYATVVHPVNVLNESFSGSPIPDTSADAVRQFDNAAVAAGITVVASSGDAGTTNTIGSPATDPNIISAGASTDLRAYAMTNLDQADVFAKGGWLNDNISAISSAGFDQTGGTMDLVAPGDSSFASCSTNLNVYFECVNFRGKASGVELTGGTSQSSPLTAGAAALVIQAYRKTHHDKNPTPAQVKKIILSTATDLGAPADEQGAGLLNTYKAVEAAESMKDADGSPAATGSTLLTSANQINAVAGPGTSEHSTVTVTNTGSRAQTVHVSGRSFGPATDVQRRSVTLSNAHSRHFTDAFGFPNNYGIVHFTVRKHENRLNASIAFPGKLSSGFNGAVTLLLIDPHGRNAGNSFPQGLSNFGNADVIDPAAGRWTGVIFSLRADKQLKGTAGKVLFEASTQKFASFGKVSPSKLTVPAGASRSFSFTAATPSHPGDADGSVVLNSGHGATSIPVTLRSDVDLSTGGFFSGVLTNGNGRNQGIAQGAGQSDYYQFKIGSGTPNVSAEVSLANDKSTPVFAYLIDPDGQIQGSGSNFVGTTLTSDGVIDVAPELQLTAYSAHAMAGVWTLAVEFGQPGVGNEISERFTGRIALSPGMTVGASGLPDSTSTVLPGPTAVPVTIKNNGAAPEDLFLDARLNTASSLALAQLVPASSWPVPLTPGVIPPQWLVPTHTTELVTTASSTVPMTFDVSPFLGDPDVFSGAPGHLDPSKSATATVSGIGAETLTSGGWTAVPAPDATSGFNAPAPTGTVSSMTMTATMNSFDASVTSNIGDYWLFSVNPASKFGLLEIKPGQTKTIDVTITPAQAGVAGTQVQGTLYLDDLVPAAGQLGGSEVLGIPYAYTVGS